LGFYLETAFKQGQYHEAATLLVLFYGLIAGIRLWLRPRYLVVYLAAALYLLPVSPAWLGGGSLLTFVTQDIWPTPVLQGQWLDALVWYQQLFVASAWPGLIETLLLSQVALGLTGLIALAVYPLACRQLSGRLASAVGHGVLLVMRSTPEMILAFILLLVLGPSALPAIVALAIHNGGLIGYLMAQQADAVKLRADANLGMNRFSYELTPRLYGGFLGYLCYRWEVILRESAIIGILGITTLGFYVDSAFEDIRFDRAAFLIVIAAMLNMLVDRLSRYLQTKTLSASSRTPLVG
jgi:phosphonate transport system permease protein